MKKLLIVLMVSLMMVMMVGCKDNRDQPENPKDERLNIWFVAPSSTDVNWLACQKTFLAECTKQDVKGTFVGSEADNSVTQMLELLKQAIADEADVIICSWLNYDSFNEIAQEAKQKGIKLIGFNQKLDNGLCDNYIGIDYASIGKLMADTVVDKRGADNLNILYLGETEELEIDVQIRYAFIAELKEIAPKARVAYEYTNGNQEEALTKIENSSDYYGHTEIVCASDLASIVASNYKFDHTYSDATLYVQSYAGSKEVLQFVKRGISGCTVVADWANAGTMAVELAQKAFMGETIDSFNKVGTYVLMANSVEAYASEMGIELK